MSENLVPQDEPAPSWKRGPWRSFPKVPNLFQYVNTGTFYARVKVAGKAIRRSLKTNVWSTARLRLHDFVKDVQQERKIQQSPTFGHATELFENPALEVDRTKGLQKDLRLPEPEQFRDLVKSIHARKDGFASHVANLVEFLVYSGMRAYSEAAWVTWADVDWNRKEIVVRGDPATGTKGGNTRRIPMLPDMENLLRSLKVEREAAGIAVEGRVEQPPHCPMDTLRIEERQLVRSRGRHKAFSSATRVRSEPYS